MPKLLLLDGNSLIHRAFHALPPLTNSQGQPTNAVYGFTNMLWKLREEEKPQYLAIAFDIGKPTLRTDQFDGYKAHRPPTAPELKSQFALVKDIVKAMNIPILELAGYEADDVLGTLVKAGESQNYEVVVVTGDKDLLQVVGPKTIVKICRQGIAKLEVFDQEKIWEKYGLKPEQIPDLKGLMGDASDNIPGVPGIGEKTALKLLQEYGSVEEVLEHLDELKGKKIKESLRENREKALLSKKLATILCSVPLESHSWEDFLNGGEDKEKLRSIFSQLEFSSLLKKLNDDSPVDSVPQEETFQTISSLEEFNQVKKDVINKKSLALQVDMDVFNPMEARLLGIYFTSGEETYYLPAGLAEGLRTILADCTVEKYGHDLKYQMVLLQREGFLLEAFSFDTMVAAYLLNPSQNKYPLEDLTARYLLQGGKSTVESIYLLQKALKEELDKLKLGELFQGVEMPLVPVLAGMEREGISIDREYLANLSTLLAEQLDGLEQTIYGMAGEKFNINSPKQLGVILFEKLKLPVGKKTKTGYSTNADVLEFLKNKHPIVEHILHYRQLIKLKSTYIDALPKLVNKKTGRVHTYLNQTVTATGRLSSSEPNLQNIPVKGNFGKEIRKAFIPNQKDNYLLAADYSQIELRILAHVTGDEGLLEAFKKEQDIHASTAAEVFDVPLNDVTSEMRSKAKAVNFGIVYGISDFGLSQNLQVAPKEAKRYIESYFAKYPGVKKYMEETVANARKVGFVTTILQRRRYLPDLDSSNHNVRSFAERTAINTPIQGSAADIIKVAMLRVDKGLREKNLEAKMLLQVHDELILEVPERELEEVSRLVQEAMEGAVPLAVALKVDVQVGKNWCDLKK